MISKTGLSITTPSFYTLYDLRKQSRSFAIAKVATWQVFYVLSKCCHFTDFVNYSYYKVFSTKIQKPFYRLQILARNAPVSDIGFICTPYYSSAIQSWSAYLLLAIIKVWSGLAFFSSRPIKGLST